MQAPEIGEDVARRVIGSLGFPADRVDRAMACLLNKGNNSNGHVNRVLSFQEVQRTLGISKSGLRRIIDAGGLVPVDITPRRIGFLADEVKSFLMSHRRGSKCSAGSLVPLPGAEPDLPRIS